MAISKVSGKAWADIAKVDGVSAADIANVSGVDAPAGAGIVTSGLFQFYDAANASSYSGSGTTWADLQGNYNVTLYNGVAYNSSAPKHFDFDGINDYARAPSTYTASHSEFTVEAWFRKDGSGNYRQSIVSALGQDLSNRRFGLNCEQYSGKGRILAYNTTGSGLSVYTTTNLATGTWYFMSGTMGSGSLKVYVNGSLENTGSLSGSARYCNVFGIGERQLTFRDFFNGDVAKVRVYNRALNASEILQNWNFEKTQFGYT